MDSESMNFSMPVTPSCGGNGMFGGDSWAWLIILLLAFNGGWGNGFGGGFGGNELYPWLNNSNQINGGFRDQMIHDSITGIGDKVVSGFGDVATQLCGGFAGVNATVTGAQNALAQQMYSNQLADLERSFAAQTASTQGMTAIQTQIATEACTTRTANSANTQAILDKLCQLELDNYKKEVDSLRSQLSDAKIAASQTAQNAFIAQGLSNEVDALYNRLNNCPVPSTPVYGKTPIFTCNSGCGCGCGA